MPSPSSETPAHTSTLCQQGPRCSTAAGLHSGDGGYLPRCPAPSPTPVPEARDGTSSSGSSCPTSGRQKGGAPPTRDSGAPQAWGGGPGGRTQAPGDTGSAVLPPAANPAGGTQSARLPSPATPAPVPGSDARASPGQQVLGAEATEGWQPAWPPPPLRAHAQRPARPSEGQHPPAGPHPRPQHRAPHHSPEATAQDSAEGPQPLQPAGQTSLALTRGFGPFGLPAPASPNSSDLLQKRGRAMGGER